MVYERLDEFLRKIAVNLATAWRPQVWVIASTIGYRAAITPVLLNLSEGRRRIARPLCVRDESDLSALRRPGLRMIRLGGSREGATGCAEAIRDRQNSKSARIRAIAESTRRRSGAGRAGRRRNAIRSCAPPTEAKLLRVATVMPRSNTSRDQPPVVARRDYCFRVAFDHRPKRQAAQPLGGRPGLACPSAASRPRQATDGEWILEGRAKEAARRRPSSLSIIEVGGQVPARMDFITQLPDVINLLRRAVAEPATPSCTPPRGLPVTRPVPSLQRPSSSVLRLQSELLRRCC